MGNENDKCNSSEIKYPHLTRDRLLDILDNVYEEIWVTDSEGTTIYANKAVRRHYGIDPSEAIGKDYLDLIEGNWHPTLLPVVYKEKRRITYEQVFDRLGQKVITTAVPLLDNKGEVDLIITSVRDDFNKIDVKYGLHDAENVKKDKQADRPLIAKTRSKKMQKMISCADKLADTDINILILGESGTGKNLLASYIHEHSSRASYPFVAINCAAIPENLLESELFGYSGSAFTGADPKGKPGLIELANKGTLFLDEIGELALPLQAKLLHVIQNKQFFRVGGQEPRSVDVRILAATNQKLKELTDEKLFREDLYWRLNTVEIELPPLRERKEDILPLSHCFLYTFNKKYGNNCSFSDQCIDAFLVYSWPGNVRQMESIIERLVVLNENPVIDVNILPCIILDELEKMGEYTGEYDAIMNDFEKEMIQQAYKEHDSTRKLAAALNISQSKAARLIRKYCNS